MTRRWRWHALACAIAIAAAGGRTSADQAPPNLAGKWLTTSDPNATSVEVAASLPNALLIITQTGNRITLERSWTKASIKAEFVCDGRQNVNGYSTVLEMTRCRWEGDVWIVEGELHRASDPKGPANGTMRERYRIDAKGVLTVERQRLVKNIHPNEWTQTYTRVPAGSGAK